ncbi:hypothetical protein CC86DRAFT_381976 [Ophiobolus disseminans]|uniref:Uncharacterized protein n=1 Tax=Ophiobolus disseminans TaxID=1469910 RepID=A0A6A7A0Y7_9PLEO|nr:hypothetical protein CC86DRAFT_381976 [Ophiobolus disseminans]
MSTRSTTTQPFDAYKTLDQFKSLVQKQSRYANVVPYFDEARNLMLSEERRMEEINYVNAKEKTSMTETFKMLCQNALLSLKDAELEDRVLEEVWCTLDERLPTQVVEPTVKIVQQLFAMLCELDEGYDAINYIFLRKPKNYWLSPYRNL